MIQKSDKHVCHVANTKFQRTEQFNNFLNWDVDWCQLEKGALQGEMSIVEDHEVKIYQFSMNRRLEFAGNAPLVDQGITVGFPFLSGYSGSWCKRELFDDILLNWGDNREFDSITSSQFNAIVLTLSDKLLTEASQFSDYPETLNGNKNKREVYTVQHEKIQRLRILIKQIMHLMNTWKSSPFSSKIWNEAKFNIACQIVSILSDVEMFTVKAKSPQRNRSSALKRALDHIEANVNEVISVRDLCRAAAASERTLQYAFQERFHVTPKFYLKAVRLNGVREQLLDADPRTTLVTDVANEWGFWHMGQFASDYKAFFNEMPMETLHCRF